MGFVESLVDGWVVETSMDEIDEAIGEEEEEEELEPIVPNARSFRCKIVEFGISSYFSDEEGCGEDGH